MKTQQITEGEAKILIPDTNKYSSPEEAPVFYNPEMEFDRSLSIAVTKAFFEDKEEQIEALDALSATGVRAIRYAKELKAKTVANDTKEEAIKLIDKNIELNREVDVKRRNEDANYLFHTKGRYDFIDIDPFGSPSPYVRNSFKALNRKRSLLGVTATDLGALSGHYPKTCFRRYGIKCRVNPWEHEMGLRNLIYSVFSAAAKEGFAVDPVLSYWRRHYYRAFFYVRKSERWINKNLSKVGYISFCENCGRRKTTKLMKELDPTCECGENMKTVGPTWISYLGEDTLGRKIEFFDPLFSKIKGEMNIKELHYDTHRMASVLESSLKKKDHYIKQLKSEGYKARETMFTGHGFRTNAPQEKVMRILKD